MRLISAAAEPALIAGVGTLYTEIFEAAPELDLLLVPVGGGSGAAAACLVAQAMAPHCEIIAVQALSSPAAHDSWRTGRCVERPNRTAAEGLATGVGFEFTQRILRERLSDFLLVSDEQIRRAQRLLITCAHTLAEGAGAAALAGLLTLGERAAGRKAAVVCTGGNASADEVAAVLNAEGGNILAPA
jgi:threonine dehydratase